MRLYNLDILAMPVINTWQVEKLLFQQLSKRSSLHDSTLILQLRFKKFKRVTDEINTIVI